jgi:hypothetical protein
MVLPYQGVLVIKEFGNKIAFDLFHHGKTKKLPNEFWQRGIYLLDIMDAVESLEELKFKGFPPALRMHKLKGIRKDEFAVLLGRVLDTSPRMWMNLQVNLDIWQAEKKAA